MFDPSYKIDENFGFSYDYISETVMQLKNVLSDKIKQILFIEESFCTHLNLIYDLVFFMRNDFLTNFCENAEYSLFVLLELSLIFLPSCL